MNSALVCSILLGTCRQRLVDKHSIKSKSKRERKNILKSPSDGESRGQTLSDRTNRRYAAHICGMMHYYQQSEVLPSNRSSMQAPHHTFSSESSGMQSACSEEQTK